MQTRSSSSASPDHRRDAQLQIVDASSFRRRSSSPCGNGSADTDLRIIEHASKGFRLPKGWTVDEIPRKNSYHIDKYYVERRTGKRFRSLVSVERYLKEPDSATSVKPVPLQHRHSHSKDFALPDGWIIEEKRRKNSSRIDRSYIEPGTGNKFRSLPCVERYLKAVGNNTIDSVSMIHSDRLSLFRNNEVIDTKPPEKVKWVLTGPGGSMFSANVSGSDVSSSVKQKWSEAFDSVIQHRF